jgi:hypothetical protein
MTNREQQELIVELAEVFTDKLLKLDDDLILQATTLDSSELDIIHSFMEIMKEHKILINKLLELHPNIILDLSDIASICEHYDDGSLNIEQLTNVRIMKKIQDVMES